MRKISNVKVVGSAITAILKRLSQLSGKAVTAIIRQLLLGAEVNEVRCQATGIWALNDRLYHFQPSVKC